VRVTIVAAREVRLEGWGKKIAKAVMSFPSIQAEALCIGAEALLEEFSKAEAFVLDPDLGTKSAAVAHRIKTMLPSTAIIVYLADAAFNADEFQSLQEGDVWKVLPESVSDKALECIFWKSLAIDSGNHRPPVLEIIDHRFW
jgi:hypothetical protein